MYYSYEHIMGPSPCVNSRGAFQLYSVAYRRLRVISTNEKKIVLTEGKLPYCGVMRMRNHLAIPFPVEPLPLLFPAGSGNVQPVKDNSEQFLLMLRGSLIKFIDKMIDPFTIRLSPMALI